MPEYTSNTTLPAIADWLREQPAVEIMTHAKPDGDAMGSSLALARTLRLLAERAGRDAAAIRLWYIVPLPPWGHEVCSPSECVEVQNTAEFVRSSPKALAPAQVITDTGSPLQLHGHEPLLADRASVTAIIDHHLEGDPTLADRRFIDTRSGAACMPVAELCRLLLGLSSCSELPVTIAAPLYLGLATDTGWFRFSSVTGDCMRLAADLLDAGVDHTELFAMIEQRQRLSRLHLVGRALSGLELALDGQVAFLPVTIADQHTSKVHPGDSGGLADKALAIDSVRVAAQLTEAEGISPPTIKISLRSKPGQSAIDVNELASVLGGGGHARAAGAKVEGTIDDVKARLIELLAERLSASEPA